MPAKITDIIQPQAFEQIRDRIGAILFMELENQFMLSGDYDLDTDVYVERSRPVDNTELSLITVSLASGRYDNKHQGSSRGEYTYHIDAYVRSATTDSRGGDELAAVLCQKLLGKCRAILENPVYKTLDFAPPSVSTTLVQNLQMANPNREDAMSIAMGRLLMQVTASEGTSLITPTELYEHYTQVKLHLTQKGYRYEYELY